MVTGASAGLGREIARAFAAHGASVVLAARGQAALEAAVSEIRQNGGSATGVSADLCDDDSCANLIRTVQKKFGRLDVLVNNVGKSSRGEATRLSAADMQAALDANLLPAVRCTGLALPLLRESAGSIVNIGSLASKTASRYLGAYPAAKFALAGYTHQLRLELADQGVHVLLVCPGPLKRNDSGSRYDAQAADLPSAASQPGGGAKLKQIDPARLAEKIVAACRRRQPEIIVPGKSRILFAVSQLWPTLGDWILRRVSS